MSMWDLATYLVLGFVLGSAPFLALLIVTKGHVRFFDSRKKKVVDLR